MTSASQYARGSTNWNAIAQAQGVDAANAAWQAAINAERNGTPLDTSTWSIFLDQITTDPFAAPLESANRLAGNSFLAFFKAPWVIAVVLIAGFFLLGGGPWLGKKLFSK